jgi:hypothetical protein
MRGELVNRQGNALHVAKNVGKLQADEFDIAFFDAGKQFGFHFPFPCVV